LVIKIKTLKGNSAFLKEFYKPIVALVILMVLITYYVLAPASPKIIATLSEDEMPSQNVAVELNCARATALSIGTAEGGLAKKCEQRENQKLSIASISKIITALVFLKHTQSNEIELNTKIQLTPADVAISARYKSELQSATIDVYVGQEITYNQLLEGMLIASAGNFAQILVNHAFGGFNEYKKAAETYLSESKLSNTIIGKDPDGIGDDTLSTANDLFELGKLAMTQETIREITTSAKFTLEGNVYENTNELIDQGFTGIKTGTNYVSGDCLLFSYKVTKFGRTYNAIGVILHANAQRFDVAKEMLRELEKSIQEVEVVKEGETVGSISYSSPLGEITQELVAKSAVKVPLAQNESVRFDVATDIAKKQITYAFRLSTAESAENIAELSATVNLESCALPANSFFAHFEHITGVYTHPWCY
jgi:D-alanyl-D-alanine carboxypeptidase (penicillin-binding protein 5/6)